MADAPIPVSSESSTKGEPKPSQPVKLENGAVLEISDDDALLMSLGYKPELKREFSYFTVFGQSFGAMGLAPAIAESIVFSLGSAGSVGMVWTFLVGTLLLIPVAFTLGELGSSMPTAGGLYYWVAKLTPQKYRAFLCWLAAYMNVLGYISIFASTIYAATLILVAEIQIGTGWVSTKNSNYGIFAATSILCFAMTRVSSRVMALLNHIYIWLQIIVLFALLIALAAATPSEYRNSASFVFADFQNTGFWTNNGWAFMLSFLTPVWVVSGFESSATIAEEAANAAKAVPFAMISSLVAAAVFGWALIITIGFTMGPDPIALVTSPLGQPMVQILLQSFGPKGAIAASTFLWIASICNCSILLVAASRETFAFARDGGLPGSRWIRKLSGNSAPSNAIAFCLAVTLVEGLLMFVNTIAINSIFNLAIMGLYFAYCLPLVSRLMFGEFKPGVFYMGPTLSYISAWYSLLWMTFIFILLLFPAYQSPNKDEMNYAIVVLGFVLVFCLVYYYFPKYGGKTFFTGPVRTIEEVIESHPGLEDQILEQLEEEKERRASHAASHGPIEKPYTPHLLATLDSAYDIKAAKISGPFIWHSHPDNDELFYVLNGKLILQLEGQESITLGPGEMYLVKRGLRHCPDGEADVLLIEKSGTVNTGDTESDRTVVPVDIRGS